MSDLELGMSVTGIDEAVRDLGKVKTAEEQVGNAAAAASRQGAAGAAAMGGALNNAGRTATTAGASVQQMAGRIQGAVASVAQLSNALGATGGGRAAGLVASMAGAVAQGAALGAMFGPAGAVVGALVGVVPLIAQMASAHRDASNAATQHANALSAVRTAIAQMRSASLQSDIAAGVFGDDMTPERAREEREIRRARIVEIEQEVSESQGFIQRAARFGNEAYTQAHEIRMRQLATETEAARAQIQTLDSLAARRSGGESSGVVVPGAVAVPTTSTGGAPPRAARAGRGAGGGAGDAEAARLAANAQMTRDLLGAATAGGNFAAPEILEAQVDLTQAFEDQKEKARDAEEEILRLADAQHELSDSAGEAQAAFENGWTDSIDQVIDQWRNANTALKTAGGTMISQSRLMERSMVATGNNIADTIGGTMKSAFEDALGAWLDGSKSFVEAAEDMVKGVIKALVMESVVQAIVEFARGVASAASQDWVAAPQHFAAAAAWAAVGVVAGGIGAGIGAFGGGGDKKGADGGDSRSMGRDSVREAPAAAPITIQVFPGAYATQSEVNGWLIGAVNGAAREGHTLDPRLVRGSR